MVKVETEVIINNCSNVILTSFPFPLSHPHIQSVCVYSGLTKEHAAAA